MTAKSKNVPVRTAIPSSTVWGTWDYFIFFHSPKQPLSTAAIERSHYVFVGIIYEDTCVVEVVPFFSSLVPRSALQEPLLRHEGLHCWGMGRGAGIWGTMKDWMWWSCWDLLYVLLWKHKTVLKHYKKKQNWRNEERREACKEMYPQGVRHVYGLEVILWVGSTAISFFIIVRFSLPGYNVARPRITHKCLIDRFLWESLLPLHFCISCFFCSSSSFGAFVCRHFCTALIFFYFLLPACIEQGVTAEKKKSFDVWNLGSLAVSWTLILLTRSQW